MHSVPIQRGANRPQGRPRHALLPFLARLAAIAGFAFAGWVALSALTHSAFAAERPERAERPAAGPDTPRHGDQGPGSQGLLDRGLGARSLLDQGLSDLGRGGRGLGSEERHARGADGASAGRPLTPEQVRDVESPTGAVRGAVSDVVPGAVSGGVEEIGGHPVRYLRARQQDVLAGRERAVRHVMSVADEAGVPQVRISDLLQGRPVLPGIVRPVTDRQPLLHGGVGADAQQTPEAQQGPEDQPDTHQARDKAARAAKAHARYTSVPRTATAGAPAHERADLCPGCRGDRRTPSPDPALPSGPDGPRGGGSAGGHPFAPVADLLNDQYPAAPSAADTGTFRRTALRDVAAPGGPSIVPD